MTKDEATPIKKQRIGIEATGEIPQYDKLEGKNGKIRVSSKTKRRSPVPSGRPGAPQTWNPKIIVKVRFTPESAAYFKWGLEKYILSKEKASLLDKS